jgi:hypothetical protein
MQLILRYVGNLYFFAAQQQQKQSHSLTGRCAYPFSHTVRDCLHMSLPGRWTGSGGPICVALYFRPERGVLKICLISLYCCDHNTALSRLLLVLDMKIALSI